MNVTFSQVTAESVKEIYKKHNLKGSIYISEGMSILTKYNEKNLEKPLHPGSTFAMITILEALHQDILVFNNEQEKDELRASALENYAQFYKDIVYQIAYKSWGEIVQKKQYGNANVSGGSKNFWQNGGLMVSAKENLDFLQRVTMNQLDYNKSTIDNFLYLFSQKFAKTNAVIVKGVSAEESSNTFILMGFIPEKNIYFVSTVEQKGKLDYALHEQHFAAVEEIVQSAISIK